MWAHLQERAQMRRKCLAQEVLVNGQQVPLVDGVKNPLRLHIVTPDVLHLDRVSGAVANLKHRLSK